MAAEPPAKLDNESRRLVCQIVQHVKSQGIFDQFRRDCIDELEQKVGYKLHWNLGRFDGSSDNFLPFADLHRIVYLTTQHATEGQGLLKSIRLLEEVYKIA